MFPHDAGKPVRGQDRLWALWLVDGTPYDGLKHGRFLSKDGEELPQLSI